MIATILAAVLGVATKAIAGYFSSKSHESTMARLMTTNTTLDTLKFLEKEYDTPDWLARWTRTLIFIPVVYVFLGLCIYIVGWKPDLSYTIQVERFMSPLWAFFSPFPINKQGLVTINSVFVMERLWLGAWFIIGFNLNKFGK